MESGTAAPATVGDAQSLQHAPVAAGALAQHDADGHLAARNLEPGEVGVDVADGGDADSVGDGFRRDAEFGGNEDAARMRSSGRSSSAVETTLSSSGSRRAWLVRRAAPLETSSPSRPSTTTCNSRWPSSWRNQKRMSGLSARLAPMATAPGPG